MKYIKSFEDLLKNINKYFFKITLPKTENEMENILLKLNEDPKKYKKIITKISKITDYHNSRSLFISLNEDDRINFMPGNEQGFNFFKNNDYKYLGEIDNREKRKKISTEI